MNVLEGQLRADGRRFGIVASRTNDIVVSRLLDGALDAFRRLGAAENAVTVVKVPGSWEIPLALRDLAKLGGFDALVALGCIIRGETYHFELVANESGAGVTRVALDHGVPVANAILTVENEAQAWARAEDKGRDAARVAVEMANLMEELS